MPVGAVEFVPGAWERLRAASGPEEAGGLVFLDERGRLDVTPLANRSTRPRSEYRADALEAAEAGRFRPSVGTWHTHVEGDARPSLTDHGAAWPDGLLVIASRGEVRVWRRLGAALAPVAVRAPGPAVPPGRGSARPSN